MDDAEIHIDPKAMRIDLSPRVEYLLREMNPWWEGRPAPRVPEYRRWLFEPTLARLRGRQAPVTVLRGPRQVGKTTLQQQIIRHLLAADEIDPRRIFHVQFDQLPRFQDEEWPLLMLSYWFERQILGDAFNSCAERDEPVFLFFDEAQNLEGWSPQLKTLVDHHTVRVLMTGSSAFRIERGRDSLAGRISTLEMGPLLLREVAALRGLGELRPGLALNGYDELGKRAFWEELRATGRRCRELRDQAFAAFADRGGYPFAHLDPDEPWSDLADRLNETVVRRVLRHDLPFLEEETDPDLLEVVFRIACRYAGQDPGPKRFGPEIRNALGRDIQWSTVVAYLRALDDSLLLRRIPPVELRFRRREQRYKLCLSDPSIRSSWLGEKIPLAPEALDRDEGSRRLAGPIAESVVGSFLRTMPGIDLSWQPARSDAPEIDFLLAVADRNIPVEVKYRQRIDPCRDLEALAAFVDEGLNRSPFGLLVTLRDVEIDDPRVVSLPLPSLLLLR